MSKDREFKGDDLRKSDPKFQSDRFEQYLNAVERLDQFARDKYDRRVIHLAVRWILDQSVEIALWGARRPDQLEALQGVFGWTLTDKDRDELERIIDDAVSDPVGPEFMAPPSRKEREKTE